MSEPLTLQVSHPHFAPGSIEGFRFLWAYYVKGYHPDRNCQPCFRGSPVKSFTSKNATTGTTVFDRMASFPYLYICGVGINPTERRLQNLHMPLAYEAGMTDVRTTYNGYVFRVENARILSISSLPDGWNGLPAVQTRCKNFQFAVEYFGWSRDRLSGHVPPLAATLSGP